MKTYKIWVMAKKLFGLRKGWGFDLWLKYI